MGALVNDDADAFPLHKLGWKAFQDLAVAAAEECLRRPVQSFLPVNDAGRDGAFIGRWEGEDTAAGESTIQCKFTSKSNLNLTLSLLRNELDKAHALAERGLARDYVIITNHPITGKSDLQIRGAFQDVGVGRCRIFGNDWIIRQIKASPRLRMMVPRLYGLGNLSDLIDARAYAQAKLILSAMGGDIQRLVVTDAHRKSVRAISEHNLVLLLGAPAAGKSTIGASIAVGAADIWQSNTIRATSPEDIQRHLEPGLPQFFWIDDAWGSTQYQRQTAEKWNQIFPLMQGAIHCGSRFLITSRDYIWNAAQKDLKLQSLPALRKSQVVINVQELTTQERAQILYNHLKMGDQPPEFRKAIRCFLPELAECKDFLPETARRLGTRFFSNRVYPSREGLISFFEQPEAFLLDTISTLSDECRAAIAVLFLTGGKVRSPAAPDDLRHAAAAFGVAESSIRSELEALNGSLLLLAEDELGPYWTYKHPTVSDAFSRYVASSPEKIEIYLRGAKPNSLVHEVVCPGANIGGSPVVVPQKLLPLLLERIKGVGVLSLRSFLSYRSNKEFAAWLLTTRPDLLDISTFLSPIADDSDATMIAQLHRWGLLPEEVRSNFVDAARLAAIEEADASFFDDLELEALLTEKEKSEILDKVKRDVVDRIDQHIERYSGEWQKNSSPDDFFTDFEQSMTSLIQKTLEGEARVDALRTLKRGISYAVSVMQDEYEPASSTSAPTPQPNRSSAGLVNLFRDIDE